jgi:hypothetical protein
MLDAREFLCIQSRQYFQFRRQKIPTPYLGKIAGYFIFNFVQDLTKRQDRIIVFTFPALEGTRATFILIMHEHILKGFKI